MTSFEADYPAFGAVHSNWVVQKFGGTSVGKFALNIIEQVVQYVYPSTRPRSTIDPIDQDYNKKLTIDYNMLQT